MSISIHWHVAFELLKGIFKGKENKKINWMILAAFSCSAFAGVIFLNTVLLNKITAYWLILLLGAEVMTVSIFFLWARRRTA
ncbi:hypothetical protein [Neobacillus bataviensis]|uniref:hypothetical protein n=1 Tax=Neobacillus bataviensis TaxID=220685 RepID=UPI001CBFE06C|nr:hypothetical protein [Neobacillus bataviensis]